MQIPYYLTNDVDYFPNPELALSEPNGLLAIGGDLSSERLLAAYRQGIFPWFDEEPILWWSPDPRTILTVDSVHISTSLKKAIRQNDFEVRADENFTQVIQACAAPRKDANGTWITKEMQNAYIRLHELGYAHSIEVYSQETLVGGIYGISLGRLFFGESMFSRKTNASKIALVYLAEQLKQWNFEFIDCQMWSPHLASLGATTITRKVFLEKLTQNNKFESRISKWCLSIT